MSFTTRLFNPLTGTDLQQIIETHTRSELAAWELLQPHLTFPKGEYKVEITVHGYPMDVPQTLTFKREFGETQETAPDKLREDHEIPVLRTERSQETGQLTDVPQPIKATVGGGTKAKAEPKVVTPVEPEVEAEPVLFASIEV